MVYVACILLIPALVVGVHGPHGAVVHSDISSLLPVLAAGVAAVRGDPKKVIALCANCVRASVDRFGLDVDMHEIGVGEVVALDVYIITYSQNH